MSRPLISALLASCLGLLVSIDNSRWQSSGNILAVFVTVENTGPDQVQMADVRCYALEGETPVAEGAAPVRQISPDSKQRKTVYIARPTGADRIECQVEKLL